MKIPDNEYREMKLLIEQQKRDIEYKDKRILQLEECNKKEKLQLSVNSDEALKMAHLSFTEWKNDYLENKNKELVEFIKMLINANKPSFLMQKDEV